MSEDVTLRTGHSGGPKDADISLSEICRDDILSLISFDFRGVLLRDLFRKA